MLAGTSRFVQRLEKQFTFPAVLVDGGDGGGPEFQVIGQKDDLTLIGRVPNYHTAHWIGTVLDRHGPSKDDQFIGQDVVRQWPHGGFHHLIGGVVLQACYEEYSTLGPLAE